MKRYIRSDCAYFTDPYADDYLDQRHDYSNDIDSEYIDEYQRYLRIARSMSDEQLRDAIYNFEDTSILWHSEDKISEEARQQAFWAEDKLRHPDDYDFDDIDLPFDPIESAKCVESHRILDMTERYPEGQGRYYEIDDDFEVSYKDGRTSFGVPYQLERTHEGNWLSCPGLPFKCLMTNRGECNAILYRIDEATGAETRLGIIPDQYDTQAEFIDDCVHIMMREEK